MKTFFCLLLFVTSSWSSTITSLEGKTIPQGNTFKWSWSSAIKGSVVVFLSAVCPCSNGHITYLKKLKEEFPDYTFIGIHSNVDEDKTTSSAYFKEAKLNFEVIEDDKSRYADMFKAFKTPHSFIVSKEGKILYQGGVTGSSRAERAEEFHLYEALKDDQSGKSIKVSQTRVLGCEISRN